MGKKKRNHSTTMNNTNPNETVSGEETPSDAVTPTDEKAVTDTGASPEPANEVTQEPETVVEEAVTTPSPVINETMIDPKLRMDFALLNEQFDRYCQIMAKSRPVSEDEGVLAQQALWRIIENVLQKEGESFTVLFSQLLALFARERRGVLDVPLRFRFFGALKLGREDARNFEGILAAFMSLCNPQDRALRIKQVDLPRVFKHYSNKAAEARVIDYFGL